MIISIQEKAKVFSQFNFELASDLKEMSRSRKIHTKVTQQYSLAYIGEVAERWEERNMVQSKEDFNGLLVGIEANKDSGAFLYDQLEQFIESILKYTLKNGGLIERLHAVKFTYTQAKEVQSFEKAIAKLMKPIIRDLNDDKKFQALTIEELMLITAFGSEIVNSMVEKHEPGHLIDVVEHFTYKTMDQLVKQGLKLSNNPFEDITKLDMLKDVLTHLNSPKANCFKEKGVSRFFKTISQLAYKEVSFSSPAASVLGIEESYCAVLNYLLLSKTEAYNSKGNITTPGFKRCYEAFLSVVFKDDKGLTNDLKEEIETEKIKELATAEVFENITADFSTIQNKHSLQYLVDYLVENDFLFSSKINRSYIYLLDNVTLNNEARYMICRDILKGVHMNTGIFRRQLTKNENGNSYIEEVINDKSFLTELEFSKLQNEIERHYAEGLDKIEVNMFYMAALVSYRYITLENEAKVKELKLGNDYILFMLQDPKAYSPQDIMLVLSWLEVKERTVLSSNVFALVQLFKNDKAMLHDYYSMYLEFECLTRPLSYPETVFKLLNDELFKDTMDIDADMQKEIEMKLIEENFLTNTEREMIRQKYLSNEELEKIACDEIEVSINEVHWYHTLYDAVSKNSELIKKNQKLNDTVYKKILEFEPDMQSKILCYELYKFNIMGIFSEEKMTALNNCLREKVIEEEEGLKSYFAVVV